MNNIKAFLFDVDGTLIDYNGKMSKATFDVLHSLKDKGYYLGINSGRPVFSSIKVLRENNIAEIFDCYYGCNGIEYYDFKSKHSSYLTYLNNDDIVYLNNVFNEDYYSLCCYKDNEKLLFNHFPKDENMMDRWCKIRFVKPMLYDFSKIEKAPKLIVIFLPEYREQFLEKVNSIKNDCYDMFLSGNDVMEIVPHGFNKGNAVVDLAKRLNIDCKDILTSGDAQNDIPALIKGEGVYVGNSDKDIAYSCLDVNHDGLANFLKEQFQLA